jgi:hypothetical protein
MKSNWRAEAKATKNTAQATGEGEGEVKIRTNATRESQDKKNATRESQNKNKCKRISNILITFLSAFSQRTPFTLFLFHL